MKDPKKPGKKGEKAAKPKPKPPPKPKPKRKKPKPKPRRQYGALPYRAGEALEILLITSRETGRWVIPKGWPMIGKSPRGAATREALEEAGAVGKAGRSKLGSYDYIKILATGERVRCRVTVFPMAVISQKAQWPEQDQRQVRWFPWDEAVDAVQEPGLKAIIQAFGLGWEAHGPPQSEMKR